VADFYGPVNLGNPVETTIIELAQLIIELTGSRSAIINKPLPADDPARRRPNIAIAEKKLNWRPQVELEKGLKRTIQDFDKRLRDN
jgi:UDP-glucuronate decarboxylase